MKTFDDDTIGSMKYTMDSGFELTRDKAPQIVEKYNVCNFGNTSYEA